MTQEANSPQPSAISPDESETPTGSPAPRTTLVGHTSEATAYVVADYPYGFRLRGRAIGYEIRQAAKGEAK